MNCPCQTGVVHLYKGYKGRDSMHAVSTASHKLYKWFFANPDTGFPGNDTGVQKHYQ